MKEINKIDIRTSDKLDFNFNEIVTDKYSLGISNLILSHADEKEVDCNFSYKHLLIDLKKWDLIWSQNQFNYIVPELHHQYTIKSINPLKDHNKTIDKINRVKRRMETYKNVNAPVITLPNFKSGLVNITAGRHRYWWFKELGLSCFVAAISEKDFDKISDKEYIIAAESSVFINQNNKRNN